MKQPSSWSDTPFWPISLKENQQKRCQKGGKPTFTKSAFQNPGWFVIIKEFLLYCFGMKRGFQCFSQCFSQHSAWAGHAAWWPVMWKLRAKIWKRREKSTLVVVLNPKMPKFELDFCPDHWGGPFGPKLHEPSIISFKHYCIKKVTFQDICSVAPLCQPAPYWILHPSAYAWRPAWN